MRGFLQIECLEDYYSMVISLVELRIAVKKLGSIMEGVEDDWIFYGILLYQRNVLISQIDQLIKQKRKYKKPYFERHLRQCLSS